MAFRVIDEEESIEKKSNITPSIINAVGQQVKEQARPYARQLVNLTSLVSGLPGDILQLANEVVARPLTGLITGKETLPYKETYLGKIIPTSEQNKENLRSINPEYLSPQNEVEAFGDAIIEDTASFFLGRGFTRGKFPLSNTISTGKNLLQSFGISLGSNTAGQVVKDFTGDEDIGSYAKLGTGLFLSLINKPAASKYVNQLYDEANKALPKNARHDATNLWRNVNNLADEVSKGSLAPSEKFVLDETKEILNKIFYDPWTGERSLNVGAAQALKRSLNEKLQKFVFENPVKASKSGARKLGSKIVGYLKNFLNDYGETNPAFGNAFSQADEGYGVLQASNKIWNVIKNNVKGSFLTGGLLKLFGVPLGKSAAVAAPLYPIGQLAYRVAKSPTLRKYYASVANAALQENIPLVSKEIHKFDKALQEEMSKPQSGKFRVID